MTLKTSVRGVVTVHARTYEVSDHVSSLAFLLDDLIVIIMYRLYSATLLRDPAALYSKSDINIKSIE